MSRPDYRQSSGELTFLTIVSFQLIKIGIEIRIFRFYFFKPPTSRSASIWNAITTATAVLPTHASITNASIPAPSPTFAARERTALL